MCSMMVRRIVSRSKLEVSERATWWKTSRSSSGMRFSVFLVILRPKVKSFRNSYTHRFSGSGKVHRDRITPATFSRGRENILILYTNTLTFSAHHRAGGHKLFGRPTQGH